MRELDYVEGQTVVFERRFAARRIEDLPALAAQLITTSVKDKTAKTLGLAIPQSVPIRADEVIQ